MRAAVYRGRDEVRLEDLPVPSVGPGEVLIRVHACGVCPTDLKKIHDGQLEPPRVFGHETAGVIADIEAGVAEWKAGDRVVVHHHIPCLGCFYCERKFYAQCARFRQTGTTAGFTPSGGGFAEYVLAKDWIVERGLIRIPDGVTFEEATFVEPVNCCLKAVQYARAREGSVTLVFGQGAMGLVLDQLLQLEGAIVIGVDPIAERRQRAASFADRPTGPEDVVASARKLTAGRGADAAILATDHPAALGQAITATRPGARIVLFATTQVGKEHAVDVGNLCVLDKRMVGAYSTSYDLQARAAELVFTRQIKVADLITHHLPLEEIALAIEVANNPSGGSLKVIINPTRGD